ncbi:MAG: ATP-binding cassette domain-containing protein [Candidatus Fimenecus sp.]
MSVLHIIEVENLQKSFGQVRAVDGITFSVEKGSLFAFLGLNGAGKSTTISIMTSTLARDGGRVTIDGMDIDRDNAKIKSEIGIVFQDSVLDSVLSGKDNLKIRAGLYGIYGKDCDERIKSLSDLLDLHEFIKRPVGKLSGGQRRRLDVARALINDPKILILDEPTTGLDPRSRKTVWEVIDRYRREKGLTVFLTTHYMEEAAEADYVVILDSGKIAAEGTPNDLKNRYTGDFIRLYNGDKEALSAKGIAFSEENGYLQIEAENTRTAKELILQNPELFDDFEIIKGKMDDVFLAATGKKLKGENE